MALFPTTIPIGYETQLTPNAGKSYQNSDDGSIVVITLFDNSTYEGNIVIPFATYLELLDIRTFYTTNKNVIWTFEHPGDGNTYSLFFTNQPSEQRLETKGDVRYKVTMPVVGTR